MTGRFAGKSAIVTGSSRGIGKAIAEALAAGGANVTLNYPSAEEAKAADEIVGAIRHAGGSAIAVQGDMTSLGDIDTLFDRSIEAFGAPDFVISNVGGIIKSSPIMTFDEALFDRVTALNAKSAFFVMRRAARDVKDHGRIVAISSSTTSKPYPGTAVYGGAKAAVELYCEVLSKEIGARHITVNSISPGLTATEGMLANPPSEARIRQVEAETPLGRLGSSMDVAAAVVMLLTEDAHWITGQHINAGGGFH